MNNNAHMPIFFHWIAVEYNKIFKQEYFKSIEKQSKGKT